MKGVRTAVGMVYEKFPGYGDLIPMEEWIDCVKSGGFIDYDGHGYYALENCRTRIVVRPSDLANGMVDQTFTHVLWMNR